MKKHFIFFALTLYNGLALGQTKSDSATYSFQAKRMLAAISRDSLKTGVLLETVYPASGLHLLPAGPDTVSAAGLRQAVSEMERATEEDKGNLLGARERLTLLRYRYRDSDTLPIVVLDASYQLLDTAAMEKGYIRYTADSALETVPGATASPFATLMLELICTCCR